MTTNTIDTQDEQGQVPADLAAVADQLVSEARSRGVELTGPNGLLSGLTKQVLETALGAEMDEHLGHERGARSGTGNVRNGSSAKTVRTDIGDIRVDVPRDRSGTFAPTVVPKHSRRLAGFDDAVLSLYAKGMTTGDIANHLADVYGTEVSRDLVSRVTDAVIEDMKLWQSRPLDVCYPVVLIDAIFLKIRDGQVRNRPVYVAMGISVDGERDVLGLWAGPSGGEGAKGWMTMLTELRNRGIADVCIVCCDGLKGLPEAIAATQTDRAAGDRAGLCGASGALEPAVRVEEGLGQDHRKGSRGSTPRTPSPTRRLASPSSPAPGGRSIRR